MSQQNPGPINGLNPLIYTGGLPNLVVMERRPNPSDFAQYVLGHWWIVPATDGSVSKEVWVLVSKRYNIAEWMRVDGSPSGLESLTGDIGGAVDPLNGNINILGGTGIQVSGNPATNTLTINGTNTNGINSINKIYITTLGAGNYTVPSNLIQAEVEVVGGGGGGSGQCGGGGGGYSRKLYTKSDLGTAQSYFVGNGGGLGSGGSDASNGENTTFGSASTLITGFGGQGGSGSGHIVSGGSGSGGNLNISGGVGVGYFQTSSAELSLQSRTGGGSMYAPANYNSGDGSAIAGNNYGGGGTPALGEFGGSVGARGAQGLIIITEYLG